MTINSQSLKQLIIGSTFLGTGGGGNPKEAEQMLNDLIATKKELALKEIEEFDDSGVFITAYGVGSISTSSDPRIPLQKSLQYLSNYLGKAINGVIPVEIGAKSVASAFYLASYLDLPVVDADIVGGRSSPEVFIETITLFNIKRTPSAIANNNGEVALLVESSSAVGEEKFFRNFANIQGERAYVVGYPLTKTQVQKAITQCTVSKSIEIGGMLIDKKIASLRNKHKTSVLFEGKIEHIEQKSGEGFSVQEVCLVDDSGRKARVFIKNENLIFWIGSEVVLTCPDLIVMLDAKGMPIYNSELKSGQSVNVVGMPAVPIWRSEQGKKLFCPRAFGFDFDAKLLDD